MQESVSHKAVTCTTITDRASKLVAFAKGEVSLVPKHAEVIVVGGGIIGLSIAFQLRRHGLDVLLLERHNCRTSASYAAAGLILPTSISADSEAVSAFIEMSHAAYPRFLRNVEQASGMKCDLSGRVGLFIAATKLEQSELEDRQMNMARRGIQAQLISPARVCEMEPSLSRNVRCGMLLRKEYFVDPQRIMAALAVGFLRIGGRMILGAEVGEIGDDGLVPGFLCLPSGAWEEFSIRSKTVVVASGCHSGNVVRASGSLCHIRPVRGQLVVLEGSPVVRRPIHLSIGYLVPRSRSSMVIGPVDRVGTWDMTPDLLGASQLRDAIQETLPVLRRLRIRDVIVGLRPKVPDKAPCLGHVRNSLFVATGHYRNGITLAAGTAKIIADLLCLDKHHALLKSFRPSRLSEAGMQKSACLSKNRS